MIQHTKPSQTTTEHLRSLDAEVSVIGSMLLDWRIIGDVMQVIHSPEDFYRPAHQQIYAAIVAIYDRQQQVDDLLVIQQLRDQGILDQCGGPEALIAIIESVPTAAHAAHYARIVRDKARLRTLDMVAAQIHHRIRSGGHDSTQEIEATIDDAERLIFAVADQSDSASEPQQIHQLVDQTFAALESRRADGSSLTGISTGYHVLDDYLAGLQRGEMIIIAARPSMGKTAIAINIAEHIAIDGKRPTAVFSLEMSKQQLTQRLLSSRAGVDAQRMRRNTLSENDFLRLHESYGELINAPLWIDDTPALSVTQLRAKARRLVAQHEIRVIFVDYLQLMSAPGSENRQNEVGTISRGVKALARELNVPVVILSQLNRNPEGRESKRPMLSDLRESGAIEQDADVVMMLHREDYYNRQSQGDEFQPTNEAEVIIVKQRNGPTGIAKLHFNPATTRFDNAYSGDPL